MRKIVFSVALIFYTFFGLSQSAVSGVVIDGDFNEPLAFANVILRVQGSQDTTAGTITDFEGRYSIIVERPGLYDLEFSYLGYETKIINEIQLTSNDETEINIVLNPAANALEEVVVTTTVRKNNEASVLAIQKGAVTPP